MVVVDQYDVDSRTGVVCSYSLFPLQMQNLLYQPLGPEMLDIEFEFL